MADDKPKTSKRDEKPKADKPEAERPKPTKAATPAPPKAPAGQYSGGQRPTG